MKTYNVYINIFWSALGIFVSSYSYFKLGIGEIQNPGAGLMPFCLGVFFFSLSLYPLIRNFLRPGAIKDTRECRAVFPTSIKKLILALAGLFIYALLVEPLGYILTTFLTMLLLFRSAGHKQWPSSAAYSGIVVLVTYFLFTYLGVRFPPGIFRTLGLY